MLGSVSFRLLGVLSDATYVAPEGQDRTHDWCKLRNGKVESHFRERFRGVIPLLLRLFCQQRNRNRDKTPE
jgi:hypothetical protein